MGQYAVYVTAIKVKKTLSPSASPLGGLSPTDALAHRDPGTVTVTMARFLRMDTRNSPENWAHWFCLQYQ